MKSKRTGSQDSQEMKMVNIYPPTCLNFYLFILTLQIKKNLKERRRNEQKRELLTCIEEKIKIKHGRAEKQPHSVVWKFFSVLENGKTVLCVNLEIKMACLHIMEVQHR